MADAKITALTELTTAEAGDLLLTVDDPAGTPVSKKITVGNFAASHGHEAMKDEWTGAGGDTAANSTTYVTVASITDTIAAGDQYTIDVYYLLQNNSGANRVFTFACDFNGLIWGASSGTIGFGTNRGFGHFHAAIDVRSTSRVWGTAYSQFHGRAPANSLGDLTSTTYTMAWNTSTSDLTGSGKTIAFKVKSDNATASQTVTLINYEIRKY